MIMKTCRPIPSLLVLLASASCFAALHAQRLNIHPVGDSITNGTGGTSGNGGYRLDLDTLLFDALYEFDFIGTTTTNSANLFDPDHDGHGGWTIGQIDANIEAWFNSIADPDIILLHIGTNDFGQGLDTPNAINRLDTLITRMTGLRPNAHVIVTNLMERGEPQNSAIQTQFNPFVEGVVDAQITAGNLVSFLDMRALVPLSDMPDNLHPNDAGYTKMAAGWFDAIEAVVNPGALVAPAIVRAKEAGAGNQVFVNFNKPLDVTSAEAAGNYVIDGGINVLSAELSANQRYVTLTTDAQTFGLTYTVTVNGVQDQEVAANTIAANSTARFSPALPRGYESKVSESHCYTLVYSLDLPSTPNYQNADPDYQVDHSGRIGSFDRVAYYLELQTAGGELQYAWVSMDAFTRRVEEIGVPTLLSGATFQQEVTNLNVVSNVPGVSTGGGYAGNLEFWPTNYSTPNAAGVPGASDGSYDLGDTIAAGGAYGSMQIHNTDSAQTVIAFNRWGGTGGNADLGIGNQPTGNPDWTFAQNGNAYFVKTLQVLVRTAGDVTAPTMDSAEALLSATGLTVRFSEPLRADTLLTSNFSLDKGVEILALTVGDDRSEIVLRTTPLPEGVPLTLTVSKVRDTSSNANEIAPGSAVAVDPAVVPGLPAEVVANVGAAADNYELLYTLEIPATGNLNAGNPYLVDNSGVGGTFSRVAYYLELQQGANPVEYVWVAMDAFTTNKAHLGVPTVASGAFFQQPVTNLDVISNKTGIVTGTGIATGNIEFWPSNYNASNAATIPGASETLWDFGDGGANGGAGYGSMQVHNHGAAQTLFALNRFGVDGNPLCLGIGNSGGAQPDWTFADNAGSYSRRVLHVMVLPTPPPPVPVEVTTNAGAEAAGYELVYTLDIPANGNLSGGAGFTDYSVNARSFDSFSRVAYYMELQATGDPEPAFVWVSMPAFTTEMSKIGVPNLASGAVFQQLVTDMTVVSNAGITTGTGLSGNLEFWPTNYNGVNSLPVPGANAGTFDFGDNPTPGNYGSMQVHNYEAGETIFALNSWGRTGNTTAELCVGIGNNPAPVNNGIDWTFADNAPDVDLVRRLHVLVLPGPTPLGGPEPAGARGSTTLDRLVVSFDREVADSAASPANFSLDGGVAVTGATLLANRMDIALATSPQTAGQLYTVSVSGVRDRSFGKLVPAGATAQFTAYTAPAILAAIPDAGMDLIYCLQIPAATPQWNLNDIPYLVDEAQYGEMLFDRVAYLMELDGDWAYASFDSHTNRIAQTGVPTLNISATPFQQLVTNLNVASNVPGIVTGNGLATGNIEFWGGNYQQANGIGVPGASDAVYDFGDNMTPGAYGCLQIHNHGAGQTILAYNNWGTNAGDTSEVGIGNQSTGNPDWTFSDSATLFATRQLYVLARPGGSPGGPAPEILTQPCDREVAAGSDVTFAVSLLGAGPFSYQWRRNERPIPGATASWLTLTSVLPSDAGNYDVVVTGPNFVSETSVPGTLAVIGGPSFITDWRSSYGFSPPDGSTPGEGNTEDKDGDLRVNLLEAAFGTNPNSTDGGPLVINEAGASFLPGDPVVVFDPLTFDLTIRYVRLANHAAAGLTYSPEYSQDGVFADDPADPAATRVRIPDGIGGMMDLPVRNVNGFDYEVVEESIYLFNPGGPGADAAIVRVRVDLH